MAPALRPRCASRSSHRFSPPARKGPDSASPSCARSCVPTVATWACAMRPAAAACSASISGLRSPHECAHMSTLVLTDPRFMGHDPGPGHVESPARLDAIMGQLGRAPVAGLAIEAPRPATDAEIDAVHDPAYRASLARLSGNYAELDPDTSVSPGSWEAATRAAGAAAGAVEAVMSGRADNAFALVRPPGHHAR